MRSYDEYCAIAKSLDLIGDRWTLLIVRELSLRAPCRYTDLRNGLPGIATNLLASRLRDLERAGVVMREDAPPPIATTVFRLTPRGADLQPILDGLIRWGLPLMFEQHPQDAIRSHWMLRALELMLCDRDPAGPPVSIELDTGDQPIVINAREGRLSTRIGRAEQPTVTVTGPMKPTLALILGFASTDTAAKEGLAIKGETDVLQRFALNPHALGATPPPTPADQAPT